MPFHIIFIHYSTLNNDSVYESLLQCTLYLVLNHNNNSINAFLVNIVITTSYGRSRLLILNTCRYRTFSYHVLRSSTMRSCIIINIAILCISIVSTHIT